MPAEVHIKVYGPGTPRVQESDVDEIVSNRISHEGREQYLVKWRWETPELTPFSWHTLDELSRCLHHVQDYLENYRPHKIQQPRKRKSPETEEPQTIERLGSPIGRLMVESRSASVTSSASDSSDISEIASYNGILTVQDGRITMTRSISSPYLNPNDVPTPYMVRKAQASSTTLAEKLVREEAKERLRRISGPSVTMKNTLDATSPPLRFTFIDKSVLREGVYQADPATRVGCQNCRPNMGQNIGCEYTKKCECLEYAAVNTQGFRSEEELARYREVLAKGGDTSGFPKKFPYHQPDSGRAGTLVKFYLESRHPIYECNENCLCGPGCKNRIVQHGRQIKLEIFKTKDRGWALRTKEPLALGQFIDTYRGEIITDQEATERERKAGVGKESYLYSLDKFAESQGLAQEELYVVDGEYFGGPTRFMNHSCEPNCRQYTVSYNKHDLRVYEIAFFAIRNIIAGEELTFDYLDKDEEDDTGLIDREGNRQASKVSVPCHCGAAKCRKWLWT